MKKLISCQTHGVADYSYAALFVAAPELVGFADEETAARLSRGVSFWFLSDHEIKSVVRVRLI